MQQICMFHQAGVLTCSPLSYISRPTLETAVTYELLFLHIGLQYVVRTLTVLLKVV